MAFKMICPKCEGLDYSVERDNRTFGAVAQAFELVFHCRCGKQMFGEQLIQEYEKQKREYEQAASEHDGNADARQVERARREEEEADLRERLEYRKRYVEERKREQAEAQAKLREEQERKWREKVQEASEVAPTPAAEPAPSRVSAKAAPVLDDEDEDEDDDDDESLHAHGDQVCAWPGCEKPRRSNSKYCSRACSNKNARARHKTRARKEKKGKTAAA